MVLALLLSCPNGGEDCMDYLAERKEMWWGALGFRITDRAAELEDK